MNKLLILMALVSLAGCASKDTDNEVLGIGGGRDGLKRSRCWQCQNLEPFYRDGQWLEAR